MTLILIIAFFILGVAAGIAAYRDYIARILSREPRTICDYCEFAKMVGLFPKRK